MIDPNALTPRPVPLIGVLLPEAPDSLHPVLRWAGAARDAGAVRLWSGETTTASPSVLLAVVGREVGIATGTSVSLTPMRHPLAAARDAATVAMVSGHEHVAGFGPGSRDAVEALTGSTRPAPVRSSARYASGVRRLLDGGALVQDDEDRSTSVSLPRLASPRVEVGLGVLRAPMARAAGQVADAAITWMTPASYLSEQLLPSVREGSATRTTAGRCRLVAVVHVAVARAGRSQAETVRAATHLHVDAPHYRDMLQRAGVDLSGPDPWRCLVERGAFLLGSVHDLVEQVLDLGRAGCSEVVLNGVGVARAYGTSAAMDDVTELAAALADVRGGGPAPSKAAGPPPPG